MDGAGAAELGLVVAEDAADAALRLLAHDPFRGERPRWVRVVSYRYRFTTHAEFRVRRERWTRDRRRHVVGPIALEARMDE